MSAHVEKQGVFFAVFAALMVLTLLTVWVAGFDFGPMSTVVALTIAVAKASLVVYFFMGVRYSTRLTKLIVANAVVWLLLMFVFTLADYMSRGWLGVPGK
jgi:cytochrome c oxidase subunit 4